MTARLRRRAKALSLLLGLLGGLLLAEVAARFAMAWILSQPAVKPLSGEETQLVSLLQKAANPGIVYEMIPLLDCTFRGVRLQTNSAGQRGPERAAAKPERGFRVLALGDSVIFGWGVEWSETCLPQLENRLRMAMPGRHVDVVGTGVPGYNTVMELEVLREKGVPRDPDIVIVDFVGNDMELPNFLLARTDYLGLSHSFLVDLATRAWKSSWLDPRSPFVWSERDGSGFVSDPARVPPEYRHLVGPEAFRAALTGMKSLATKHGFHLLMTCHYDLTPEAEGIRSELGIPLATAGPRVRDWLEKHGDPAYLGSPLTVSSTDPHPSSIVHGFWAEAVTEKIEELGWLRR